MSERTIAPPAKSVPPVDREPGVAQLVLLLSGTCMAVLGAVLIAPVLPQMTDAFTDTPGVDVLVPIVLTVPALVIGLTAPFAGMIIDRVDRKRLLIVAMIAYSIFGTAPLYLDSLGAIVASRVFVGMTEAAIITCCTTLIGDYWSGPRRIRYLSLQTLVAALSATVFLGLGGVLGESGWRTPFWLYAVAAVLALPMALLLWQPRESSAPGTDAASVRELTPLPWRQLLAPSLVTLVGGVMFFALIVQLPFVLDEVGVSSSKAIGGISALMSLATAVGALVFSRLVRLTPRQLLTTEFAITACGLFTVFATENVAVIALGAVITGFGTGMLLPTLLTWSVNGLTFSQRGRGTGIFNGSLFVGEFASPIIIIAIGVGVGGLQPALGVLGLVAALMALVAALALKAHQQPLEGIRP